MPNRAEWHNWQRNGNKFSAKFELSPQRIGNPRKSTIWAIAFCECVHGQACWNSLLDILLPSRRGFLTHVLIQRFAKLPYQKALPLWSGSSDLRTLNIFKVHIPMLYVDFVRVLGIPGWWGTIKALNHMGDHLRVLCFFSMGDNA